jgi:hypothetical protein
MPHETSTRRQGRQEGIARLLDPLKDSSDVLAGVHSDLTKLTSPESSILPKQEETAQQIKNSLQKINDLLPQSLPGIQSSGTSDASEAEQSDRLIEILERIEGRLESGSRPFDHEVLDRTFELLKITIAQAKAGYPSAQPNERDSELFELIETQLQEIAKKLMQVNRADVIPIFIPQEEKSPIVMVRVDRLRLLEHFRNDESKWHSKVHLFIGGIIGVSVNWATSENHHISDVSLVVLIFFAILAARCFFYEKESHQIAEQYKMDDMGLKDDSHDQAVRTPTRSLKAGSGRSRPSGGSKKAPSRTGTRGGGGRGRPKGHRGGAS